MRWFIILISITLYACGGNDRNDTQKEKAIIRVTDSESRGMDPQLVSDLSSIRISADMFEGLTRMDAAGHAIPGLAKEWDISPDGKIWTFHLRPRLTFSDGHPIMADIFMAAFNRMADPKSGSHHASLFSIISHIGAPAPDQVVITLRHPFPQLLSLLAHPAMAALPFHRIDKAGNRWTADRPLVTSGPYMLTDWRLNQYMTLVANPHWHGGTPATKMIIWKPVDNAQSAMRLYLAGRADILSDFPANRTSWLHEHAPGAPHVSEYLGIYYYAFNTRRPPFDDARVRRALAMAIDRTWIAHIMMAAGNEPAWGILPPALSGEKPGHPPWINWSQERRLAAAKAILSEAGYGPDTPLVFEIRFNNSPEHRRVSAAMATMWRAIGVQASLLNSEASLHFDSLKRGDFMLARSGWIADIPAPENFLSVHRMDAGAQNYSGYANPAYDAALDAALGEADRDKRLSQMREAEDILINDMPILPIYFYTSRNLVRPDISGWIDNPSNIHPSHYLAIQGP